MDDSDDGQTRHRKRGIYLLPNLFTTGTLFAGFYAIIAATQDQFKVAAIAIFIAMLTDFMDGRVARWTHTESDFGIQFDSLADLVAFGMAAGLLAYMFSLHVLNDYNSAAGKLGWLAAFFYVAAAALRLARFNITRGRPLEKKVFLGLPSPAAAGIVAGFVWVASSFKVSGGELVLPMFILTLAGGGLMVSNFRYRSFKSLGSRRRVPFYYVLVMLAIFVLIVLNPQQVLFAGFVLFALSGPFTAIRRYLAYRRR